MESALNVVVGADISKLQAEMQKAAVSVNSFSSKIASLAGGLAIGLGAKEAVSAALELSKLAGQAEGVRNAFNQLQGSAQVMMQLKAATQNTVSELDLMKAAVQANNFSIPIQQLGALFEFAHQRAVATGQSVEYLTRSIVTGIGRKSPLILDNLGISAIDLKEKLKGVGTEAATVADVAKAVGEIAEESLRKAGKAAENAATQSEQLSASWENLKVSLGDLVNEAGLPKLINFLREGVELIGLFLGKREAASKESIQAAINAFNSKTGDFEDKVQLFNMIKKAAAEAGIQLINLKENTNDLGKLFIKPQPVTFINGAAQDAKNAAAALELTKQKAEEAAKALSKMLQEQDKQQSAILAKMSNKKVDMPNFLDSLSQYGSPNIKLPDFSRLVNAYRQTSEEIKTISFDMSGVVSNAFVSLGQALGNAISGAGDFAGGMLRVLGGILTQLGKMAIQVGVGLLGIKTALQTLNPFVAIAAGVALVALGAAVSGSVKSLGGSMGSGGGGGGGTSGPNPRAIDNYLKDRERINSTSWDGMQLQIVGLIGNNFTAAMRKSNYQTSITGG